MSATKRVKSAGGAALTGLRVAHVLLGSPDRGEAPPPGVCVEAGKISPVALR
ncbi:hypothetical protein ACMYSM_06285 [Raoultella planticola]|uniref:hypothetical protein n=1 Tax=Raoultella planticola TaxID=575 RepID=UPI003DA925D4